MPGRCRIPLLGEIDEKDGGSVTVGQLELGIALHLLGHRAHHGVGDVRFSRLEHGQVRGVIRNAPPHELLHVRRAAPVGGPRA